MLLQFKLQQLAGQMIDQLVLTVLYLHAQAQKASGRGISQLCVSIMPPHPSPLLWLFSAFRKSLRNVNGRGGKSHLGNDEWAGNRMRVCS